MESVSFDFEYEWEPFTVQEKHLTFEEHRSARLNRTDCSHWGAAIYKWEGPLTRGAHAGQTGVLVGETADLRQRIKQYVSGTQESGNKFWREKFLTRGNIRLYVLRLAGGKFHTLGGESTGVEASDIGSENIRLVLEQLLISQEVAHADKRRWLVNRKR